MPKALLSVQFRMVRPPTCLNEQSIFVAVLGIENGAAQR
jgi:hypothetical protein